MNKSPLQYMSIDLAGSLGFIHCGKLVAQNFIHASRCLDLHVLIVIESGVLNIDIDGVQYKARKGELLLLPAGIRHSGFKDEDTEKNVSYFWAHFIPNNQFAFDTPCGRDTKIPVHFKLSNPARINILCNQILDISKEVSRDIQYCSFLLSALVCEISAQSRRVNISQNKTVNTAVSWIELHLTEPISLDDAAEALKYNKRYLARIFKESMGISLNQYIEKCKIELAKNMLTGSDASVSSIAAEVGYEDAGYFMRVFKKHEGITCMQYRSSYSKMYLNKV